LFLQAFFFLFFSFFFLVASGSFSPPPPTQLLPFLSFLFSSFSFWHVRILHLAGYSAFVALAFEYGVMCAEVISCWGLFASELKSIFSSPFNYNFMSSHSSTLSWILGYSFSSLWNDLEGVSFGVS
jgi:hypothetical protein